MYTSFHSHSDVLRRASDLHQWYQHLIEVFLQKYQFLTQYIVPIRTDTHASKKFTPVLHWHMQEYATRDEN